MNTVRKRVIENIKPYIGSLKHKDLTAFTVGAEYFTYDHETDTELDADFTEILVVVEKEWLFNYMMEEDIKNPLEYLQNEYTWDESINWFENAKKEGKIVTIEFK